MKSFLLLALAAQTAVAGEVFICTDAKRHKAVQDRPCAEGQVSEQRHVDDHPVTFNADRYAQSMSDAGKKIRCDAMRQNVQSYKDFSATAPSNRAAADYRDAWVREQRRLDRDCH